MKKKFSLLGIAVGCFLGGAIIAYAITVFFFTKSAPISITGDTVFQFDISTGADPVTISPGDSFTVSPTIYNDASEDMYVFIAVEQPTVDGESLYTYTVGDSWKQVSSTAEKQIYAYAGDEMTTLFPGETTVALTSQMTMKGISNAVYAQVKDNLGGQPARVRETFSEPYKTGSMIIFPVYTSIRMADNHGGDVKSGNLCRNISEVKERKKSNVARVRERDR